MRVVITGVKGQLGHDVLIELRRRGWDAIGVDLDDFDLTRRGQTLSALERLQPEAVVHCAAYTAVDRAEDEPALAMAVNGGGTRHVAEYCASSGAWLLYISTDYVFGGGGTKPWEAGDPTDPQNAYGRTKLAGELAARELCERRMILRTSWVYGAQGSNFVKTMLRLGRERAQINVVDDQIGAPSYTVDLAGLIGDMLARPQAGIYHAANTGECSWAGFAREIFRIAGYDTKVIPVSSAEYPTAAKRPMNSRLSFRSLEAAGYALLPKWEHALERFLWEENG
ncbi:MAG: dTDP-4-dehydrorhamnose reductase [Oscillospiraceae bacterium]|nr:dTDP-4-dehydrorhamnose reductase [Oscillospiraceae bacterium]